MKITLNKIIFLLLVAAFSALSLAYLSQYIFGYLPCKLCIYQRWPFFLILIISVLSLIFASFRLLTPKMKRLIIAFLAMMLLTNSVLAFYHFGVEKKFFKLNVSCDSQMVKEFESVEELQDFLMQQKNSRCDEPSFIFLGLSMAAWNMIYCLIMLLITIFAYRKVNE